MTYGLLHPVRDAISVDKHYVTTIILSYKKVAPSENDFRRSDTVSSQREMSKNVIHYSLLQVSLFIFAY